MRHYLPLAPSTSASTGDGLDSNGEDRSSADIPEKEKKSQTSWHSLLVTQS